MRKIFTFFMALIATCALWANNVITYTASEKLEEVTDRWSYGLHTNAFNVSITNHTFENGTGTITFAGEVTSIGGYAFFKSTSLTAINIPESVTSIGDGAFFGCSALTSITIPESVKTIGKGICSGCSGLKSITWNAPAISGDMYYEDDGYYLPFFGAEKVSSFVFGPKVETIPAFVCYNMPISEIIIPESVTTIEYSAFRECTSLTSITIPSSVTSIGDGAFSYCSDLTSITIGNSVTSIGDRAFEYCYGLTSITIPNSVTSIGEWAFSCCSGLTSITIPNSVTSIGKGAFSGCYCLTSITIPNSVTSIGERAFSGCSSLPVENGIRYADTYLVEAVDKSQNTYAIKDGTKWIGESAFNGCSGLTSITIPNSVTSIEYGAFEGCDGLTSITIPNSVTSIEKSAFYDCSGLTSITIPNSVTSIGDYAFSGCSALKTVINLSYLDIVKRSETHGYVAYYADKVYTGIIAGDFVILNDTILSGYIGKGGDVVIPEGITNVEERAFEDCSGLTTITIPNSVTNIGYRAFYRCNNLKTVINLSSLNITKGNSNYGYVAYYANKVYRGIPVGDFVVLNDTILTAYIGQGGDVVIPETITNVEERAFYGCSSLTSITIPNSVTSIGEEAFDKCSGLTSITIPNSVTSIGDYAFDRCSGLTSITIGNSVTSIGEGAFASCSGLTSITIPNSVTSIESGAFHSCSGLTSITIPESVKTIGKSICSSCSGLKSITWNAPAISGDMYYDDDSYYHPFYGAEKVSSFVFGPKVETIPAGICYNMPISEIIIPESVTTIEYSPFCGCTNLTSITIPDSVTSIGDWAFFGCSGLTSITIPESVKTIGKGICNGCSGLKSITWNAPAISGDMYYGDDGYSLPFYGAEKVSSFVFGPKVETIPAFVCYNMPILEIIIPESVTTIEYSAFRGCTNLTSITIPSSVTSIGDWAFSGCSGLTSITIPNSVTSIGEAAFGYCSGLTSITIPNSVTSIEDYAFYDCTNLKTVYNLSSLDIVAGAETHGYVAYYADNVYTLIELTLSSSDPLKGTAIAIVDGDTCTGSTIRVSSITEITLVAMPTKGYQFNGWSDGNTDNPRTITLTQDTNLVATFGTKMCTLTIISNDEEVADITGAGTYEYGKMVTVEADIISGYHLEKWSNGSAYNPYKFRIYDDMTLYAFFAEDGGATVVPSEMTVTPADDNATLQWPQVDNATSYTMTITKGGETICTLTFNGLGQLININVSSAPARAAASAKVASATTGFNFTVTGLDSGTTYGYLIEAKNEKGEVISTEEGTFTTTGEGTAIEETTVNKYVNTATKVIRDGQLFVLREGKTYNMQGAVVE